MTAMLVPAIQFVPPVFRRWAATLGACGSPEGLGPVLRSGGFNAPKR